MVGFEDILRHKNNFYSYNVSLKKYGEILFCWWHLYTPYDNLICFIFAYT